MAEVAVKLDSLDWEIVRVALLAEEKALRRSMDKYKSMGRDDYVKIVQKDIATVARILMVVPTNAR